MEFWLATNNVQLCCPTSCPESVGKFKGAARSDRESGGGLGTWVPKTIGLALSIRQKRAKVSDLYLIWDNKIVKRKKNLVKNMEIPQNYMKIPQNNVKVSRNNAIVSGNDLMVSRYDVKRSTNWREFCVSPQKMMVAFQFTATSWDRVVFAFFLFFFFCVFLWRGSKVLP